MRGKLIVGVLVCCLVGLVACTTPPPTPTRIPIALTASSTLTMTATATLPAPPTATPTQTSQPPQPTDTATQPSTAPASPTLFTPPTTQSGIATPISTAGAGVIVHSIETCNEYPFRSFLPIPVNGVGQQARIAQHVSDSVALYAQNAEAGSAQPLGSLAPGTVFTVRDGPFCYQPQGADADTLGIRQWQVESTTGQVGWLAEYDADGWLVEENYVLETWSVVPERVTAGETVTVTWAFSGLRQANIQTSNGFDRFGSTGLVPSTPALPPSGSVTLTVSEFSRYLSIFFWYPAEAGPTLMVNVDCPHSWRVAQTSTQNCPTAPELAGMVYQAFERGFMVWVPRSDSAAEILIFTQVGARHLAYVDGWDGQPLPTPEAPPPAGLFVPENGFGKVWREQVGVAETLGYATGPEIAYEGMVQWTVNSYASRVLAIDLPDGRTVVVQLGYGEVVWRSVFGD